MEIIIVISLVALLVLGALFVIPRSYNKESDAADTSLDQPDALTSNFDEATDLGLMEKYTEGSDSEIGSQQILTEASSKSLALNNVVIQTSRSYTKKEVSTHNTRKDCWIIISDKVYDVTPYVEEHPGGDAILNNAGGDSTQGFFGPHGTRVFDIIEDFCISKLKD